MATIKERTDKDGKPRYTVEIRLKGAKRQTATFKKLSDAKKWVQDTESAIRNGRHFKTIESKKHTVAEMLDRYIVDVMPNKFKSNEIRIRGPILQWWKSELGHIRLSDLNVSDFVVCRDKLVKFGGNKGRPLAAATIKRHFVAIGHVLKIAQLEWRWLEQNPLKDCLIEMPELPDGRVRFLNNDELKRLTAACKVSPNKLLYPAFVLSVSTGMRKSETMNLYWREPENPPTETAWGVVNLTECCIILHSTKNGDRRRVPLANQALIELQKLSKIRRLDTYLVFPSSTHPHQPIELKKAWHRALKQAEITNFRFHDLRHCAASYLAMNGASLIDIAAVLGHRTLEMVKRYSHLSDSHVSSVVASMNEKIFGGV